MVSAEDFMDDAYTVLASYITLPAIFLTSHGVIQLVLSLSGTMFGIIRRIPDAVPTTLTKCT